MSGWATLVFAREFDAQLERLTVGQRASVSEKIMEVGRRLGTYPHYRMTGRNEFRLRVGDYRVIYQFDVERNEIFLIALGHRREIYR